VKNRRLPPCFESHRAHLDGKKSPKFSKKRVI